MQSVYFGHDVENILGSKDVLSVSGNKQFKDSLLCSGNH